MIHYLLKSNESELLFCSLLKEDGEESSVVHGCAGEESSMVHPGTAEDSLLQQYKIRECSTSSYRCRICKKKCIFCKSNISNKVLLYLFTYVYEVLQKLLKN